MYVYTRQQLLDLRNDDVTPSRQARKAIFSHRLWLPAYRRRNIQLNNNSSEVVSSSRCEKLTTFASTVDECENNSFPLTSPAHSRSQITNQQQCGSMKFGLLNAQSVGNKYTTVNGEIVDRKIDACLLTETWHSTGNDAALRRCVPPGYALYEVARKSDGSKQNHGGVAAIVSSNIKYRPIRPTAPSSSFESMAFTLSIGPSSIAILLLYRPGSETVTNEFFKELTSYMEAMALYKCQLVIAGDLNINVADNSSSAASRLRDLLTSFDCTQRVTGETQVRGGTLDHVIIRSSEAISDLFVGPPGAISDHGFITWNLPFTHRTPMVERRAIRGWKRVDRNLFRQSIKDSELCANIPDTATAESLFEIYETVLRSLADKFAPVRMTVVRKEPIAVWFDDESRLLRRQSRRLERRYRRTGLASDRMFWIHQEKIRHKTNRLKENSYWLARISEHSGQPRKLWRSFSSVMGLDRAIVSSIGGPTAQNLLDFFVQKIKTIRQSTGGTPPTTKLPHTNSDFSVFQQLTVDEVHWFISSSRSKSCSLDPIPTNILKEFLPELLPFISTMCNKSLQEGHLPNSQKFAILTPIIKKSGLNIDNVQSYRPISNLTYMSKIIERMVYKQLIAYLEKNNLIPKHQSGFRVHHSTETALLKVCSDILGATDQGKVSLLGLLDMSAAFDTVDHDILLDRLSTSFGITGTAFSWLRSFLADRAQQVSFNSAQSSIAAVSTGVPQGSVLGPLLFLLYSADVPVIADLHGLSVHCYADDGQVYISDRVGAADGLVTGITTCIKEIDLWMSSNRLKLNSDKTQFIWLGSRQQLQKLGVDDIQLNNHVVAFQSSVYNLGVHLDSHLTMKAQVQRICQTSFYQLRQLRSVRRSLSAAACSALVHAFITSRLDYCNSLLTGIGVGLLDQLQSVMRVAARLVLRRRKFDKISADIRDRLHWLPIRSRINFKLGLLVYKCLHGSAPAYLMEMLELKSDVPTLRRLRSTTRGNLVIPRTNTKIFGPRGFAAAGPAFWNTLPDNVRDQTLSPSVFKQRLKFFLFNSLN